MYREGIFEGHRLDTVLVTYGAANVAQGQLGPVPQGYAWYVENFAHAILGNSHTCALEVAITPDDTTLAVNASWDSAGLVWVSGSGASPVVRNSIQPGIAWRIGPGHWLHWQAHAGTGVQGDVLSATAQVAVHVLDPQYLMTPEDAREVMAAHERVNAGLVHSAVAEHRAV
jgi:hypothetical protein